MLSLLKVYSAKIQLSIWKHGSSKDFILDFIWDSIPMILRWITKQLDPIFR